MGKRYLIDSNILIKYQGNLLSKPVLSEITTIVDDVFNISVISELEVLGHSTVDNTMKEFIGLANVYNLSNRVKKQQLKSEKHTKLNFQMLLLLQLL